MFEILKREEMADGTVVLNELSAPHIAGKAKPGQFVILKANENGNFTGGSDMLFLIFINSFNRAFLLNFNYGELPIGISASLPVDGTYLVGIVEFPIGNPFIGDYCLELISDVSAFLQPTYWVE